MNATIELVKNRNFDVSIKIADNSISLIANGISTKVPDLADKLEKAARLLRAIERNDNVRTTESNTVLQDSDDDGEAAGCPKACSPSQFYPE